MGYSGVKSVNPIEGIPEIMKRTMEKGIDIPRLMVIFNHASQKQTLDYLCIQAEEIREVYLTVEL